MERKQTVTLADVAARAGVSLATASKALNGKDRVSASTRTRVHMAARDLSFHTGSQPGVRGSQTGKIGLLTSDLSGRFSLPILIGAEDALASGQLSVFLCDARGDAVRERHHLAALIDHQIDGLIVLGGATYPRQPLGRRMPVPVVYVYQPSSNEDDVSLVPDNVDGGHMAAEHLISLGRRHIAHICGPREDHAATDRRQGMQQALAAADLEWAGETPDGEWSEKWGRSATAMLLAQNRKIDAILCDSDRIARGAMDALKQRGLAIPDDIAITGFDNWDVLAEGPSPQLTSVDLGLQQLGLLAAHRLFEAMAGKASPKGVQRHPCRLIVRGSTVSDE